MKATQAVTPAPRPAAARHSSDDLLGIYQAHGGLISGEDVTRLWRHHTLHPATVLQRHIAARELVFVEAGGRVMLPLFQFEPITLTLRSGVIAVVRELARAFDDAEIAQWFVRPNEGLDGARPVDRVVVDGRSVSQAARSDRAFALGW